jgi:hypothetical protein
MDESLVARYASVQVTRANIAGCPKYNIQGIRSRSIILLPTSTQSVRRSGTWLSVACSGPITLGG